MTQSPLEGMPEMMKEAERIADGLTTLRRGDTWNACRAGAIAALQAAESRTKDAGWRPIETALKNGDWITIAAPRMLGYARWSETMQAWENLRMDFSAATHWTELVPLSPKAGT